MTPIITIVIATYGGPEWQQLARDRAYHSAILQDEAELVVIAHYPDGTRASSLNDALGVAIGDWVVFLDADDELAPGYIGAMRRALEQNTDGDHVLFTPAVQRINRGRASTPTFFDPGRATLRDANWIVIGTMISKTLFDQVGGFDDHPHGFEDFALWSKCYRLGAKVVKVPDAVYRYHINPQSQHRQGWRDRKWQRETHNRVIAALDEWERTTVA